jgi:hypothetical protein
MPERVSASLLERLSAEHSQSPEHPELLMKLAEEQATNSQAILQNMYPNPPEIALTDFQMLAVAADQQHKLDADRLRDERLAQLPPGGVQRPPLPEQFRELPGQQDFLAMMIDGDKTIDEFIIEEPMYPVGIRSGFEALTHNENMDDVDRLEAIQVQATRGVHNAFEDPLTGQFGPPTRGQVGVRDQHGVSFGVVDGVNATDTGTETLRERTRGELSGFAALRFGDGGRVLEHDARSRDAIRAKMAEIFADHRTRLQAANTSDQHRRAIVDTAQWLDQLHPFQDGNLRAIATLWMNGELARCGELPTVMEDPNRLDACDAATLDREVLRGQERFESLYPDYLQGEVAQEGTPQALPDSLMPGGGR